MYQRPVHWTYRQEMPKVLSQGDVLSVSKVKEEVGESFSAVHPNLFDAPFLLLCTQSCDIANNKARVLSLAPCTPIEDWLFDHIAGPLNDSPKRTMAEFGYASTKAREKAYEWLRRLINNDQPDLFFLFEDPAIGLQESVAADLRKKTYLALGDKDKLLTCRVASLNDEFRARLAWMLGEMYARVGTRDWPKPELKSMTESLLSNNFKFLTPREYDGIEKAVEQGKVRCADDIKALKEQRKIPSDAEVARNRAQEALLAVESLTPDQRKECVTVLSNSNLLRQ